MHGVSTRVRVVVGVFSMLLLLAMLLLKMLLLHKLLLMELMLDGRLEVSWLLLLLWELLGLLFPLLSGSIGLFRRRKIRVTIDDRRSNSSSGSLRRRRRRRRFRLGGILLSAVLGFLNINRGESRGLYLQNVKDIILDRVLTRRVVHKEKGLDKRATDIGSLFNEGRFPGTSCNNHDSSPNRFLGGDNSQSLNTTKFGRRQFVLDSLMTNKSFISFISLPTISVRRILSIHFMQRSRVLVEGFIVRLTKPLGDDQRVSIGRLGVRHAGERNALFLLL